MELLFSSDPEREHLVVELSNGEYSWADITYDDGLEGYRLTIYPPEDSRYEFDLFEIQRAFEEALSKLIERGYPEIRRRE